MTDTQTPGGWPDASRPGHDAPESGPPPRDANDPANKLYTWEHVKAARREGIEAAAKMVETHVYSVSNQTGPHLYASPLAKLDLHHKTVAAAIRALLEDGR